MEDDDATKIGIRFKNPASEEKMLSLVPYYKGCLQHNYVIDSEADIVTCSKCDKTFNPMSVLVDLSKQESLWMRNFERYADEMKRLSGRSRTKCHHCKKMTDISGR